MGPSVKRLTLLMLFAVLYATTVKVAGADVDPLAAYRPAIERLPVGHWRYVKGVTLDPTTNGKAYAATSTVLLPPYNKTGRGDGVLWHEVGHVWFYNHPAEDRAYCAQFWPDGKPIGHPVSRYARTSCHEDEAETYAEMIERGRVDDDARQMFMARVVSQP